MGFYPEYVRLLFLLLLLLLLVQNCFMAPLILLRFVKLWSKKSHLKNISICTS